jgi:hypothetical protein
MPILDQVITNVYNAINAGSYFRSTTEMQSAISLANTQLYQKFRGNMAQYQKNSPKAVLNFGETTITLDSLAELFFLCYFTNPPLIIYRNGYVVDLVENINVEYDSNTILYGAKILPSNQFITMANNQVVTFEKKFPLCRFLQMEESTQGVPPVLARYLKYEILPSNWTLVEAAVYVLPKEPVFTLTDTGGPIPQISIIEDLVWTPEKIPALVMLTIQNLGFTLQNGVLIQGSASQLQQQL